MKKAIVFGLGIDYYMGFYQLKESYEITALTDNNEEARKWASNVKMNAGISVIMPDEIMNIDYDIVVIAVSNPVFVEEISKQLSQMGIEREKIIAFKAKGVSPFLIDPKFYEEDLSYEEKKELFANNVEHITIEPNSKCNRKCWFCPNSIFDRYSQNISMQQELFEKIIKELKEIDYNGIISYSFYNEPLLDTELENKIRYVRQELPRAVQLVSTNGDYLTMERMHSLMDAGLQDMVISVYDENDPDFEWTVERAKQRVQSFIDKLDLDVTCMFKSGHTVTALATKDDLNIRLQNHDFRYAANNRGETLSNELPFLHIDKHTKFCPNSFIAVNIYYDGSVYTCGNCRNDYEKHKEFEMGNIANDTIFNIFHSKSARKYRKGFTADFNQYPCRSCTFESDTFIIQFPNIPLRDRPRYTRNNC